MDIEKLKITLETISKVSESAQEFGLYYLLLTELTPLFIHLVWAIFIYLIFKSSHNTLKTLSKENPSHASREI